MGYSAVKLQLNNQSRSAGLRQTRCFQGYFKKIFLALISVGMNRWYLSDAVAVSGIPTSPLHQQDNYIRTEDIHHREIIEFLYDSPISAAKIVWLIGV